MLLAGFALACGSITGDLNEVIAIDVTLPDSGRMELGDTLVPHARALDGRGDSVAATVYWDDLDTLLQIVDSSTGALVGRTVGTGLIQARVGNLRSNPQAVTVLFRADTAFADSTPAPDSVSLAAKPDSLSDSLRVRLETFTDSTSANLSGRLVTFQLLYPTDSTSFALTPGDSVFTDVSGLAVVQVRLRARALPDSAVVQATARRVTGATVHGAPITFVVKFTP